MFRIPRRTVWKVIRCLFPLWCIQTFKCILSPFVNACFCCCDDTHKHQNNYELFVDDDLPPNQPLRYEYDEPAEFEQRAKFITTPNQEEQKREYIPPTLPQKLQSSQELREIHVHKSKVEEEIKEESKRDDSQTFGNASVYYSFSSDSALGEDSLANSIVTTNSIYQNPPASI